VGQERLADAFHRGHDFKLRDRLLRIDMIDAFATIEISLMHLNRCAGSLGIGLAPFPDGNVRGPRLAPVPPALGVARHFTKIVQCVIEIPPA